MLRLLQLLFLGHFHKWKTINSVQLFRGRREDPEAQGIRYIQECETCGKVIKRDLI